MKKNTLFQLPKKFALHFTALFFILYEYTVYKYIYLFLRVFICPEHYHCCQWLSVLFISGFFLFFLPLPCVFQWEHLVRMTFIMSVIFTAVSDDRIFSMMDNPVSLFSVCSTRKKKKKKVNICIIHGSPTRVLLNMYIWKLVSWLNKRWSSVVYLNLRASLETSFRLALEAPRAQSVDRCARL